MQVSGEKRGFERKAVTKINLIDSRGAKWSSPKMKHRNLWMQLDLFAAQPGATFSSSPKAPWTLLETTE